MLYSISQKSYKLAKLLNINLFTKCMNKSLYKITAWILIVAGIIYAITNLYFSFGGPTIADRIYEFGFGFLFSVLIFVLSFFPGKYYLAIGRDESKHNKLTNSSLILTIVGLVIVVATFIIMQLTPSDGWEWMYGLAFGIFPAGFLYAIAVILLLVNRFKKH